MSTVGKGNNATKINFFHAQTSQKETTPIFFGVVDVLELKFDVKKKQ